MTTAGFQITIAKHDVMNTRAFFPQEFCVDAVLVQGRNQLQLHTADPGPGNQGFGFDAVAPGF